MLAKDTWTALLLTVLSSGVSGMRVSSKETPERNIADYRKRNPMRLRGQKQKNQNHDKEGLTRTQLDTSESGFRPSSARMICSSSISASVAWSPRAPA